MGYVAALVIFSILNSGGNAQSPASAETTVTTCNEGGDWWLPLRNVAQQDPCSMINSARARTIKDGPTSFPISEFEQQTNRGLCTKESYSLYGACKACQSVDRPALGSEHAMMKSTFTEWSKCPTTSPEDGNTISTGDPFSMKPDWLSRLTVLDDSLFDVDFALQAAAADEPVTIPPKNATTPDFGGTATNTRTQNQGGTNTRLIETPSSTVGGISNSESSASKSSSNIGPIVGGVIGGIVLLALLGGLLFIYRRRSRQKVAPSAEFAKFHAQPTIQPTSRPPMAEADPTRVSASTAGYAPLGSISPPPADENGDVLPAFTPGHYVGPIFEKGGHVSDPNSPLTNPASTSSRAGHSAV